MNLRGSLLASLCIALLLSASPVDAQTETCGVPELTTNGVVFADYENIEYSPDGFLIYRFWFSSTTAANGAIFQLERVFFDDSCNATNNSFQPGPHIFFPTGVSNWSVRLASTTLTVWDDENDVVIHQYPIPEYPPYTRLMLRGHAASQPSLSFESRRVPIKIDAEAPVFENSAAKAEACPEFVTAEVFGLPFDTYERVEYVDGLLRVHLRFKSLVDGPRSLYSNVLTIGDDCVVGSPTSAGVDTSFPDILRYYSFRMISPTEWQLWDDDRNLPMDCTGCSGSIPEDTPFVAFYARYNGNLGPMALRTTPFPPTIETSCVENCFSNVLFIPGIKATELYEGNSKRWIPGIFNSDGQHLAMNEFGESVNVISVGEPLGDVTFASVKVLEIYGEFFEFLDNLRAENSIHDWKSAPYDWRYDVYDVVSHDQDMHDGSIQNLIVQIHELAASSKTGKVTIVGHSNGGLVGKALIDALGDDANLVDRFIMVGTPQLGTPSAIAAMLHGTGQGLPIDSVPFAMSKSTSREISENMPGAYGLLPLAGYFNVIADSIIEFDDALFTNAYRNAYGDAIDSANELLSFALGTEDGRAKPASVDTLTPTILNSTMLSNALASRNSLESWTPPLNLEVIQISGWGLDTMRGIRYEERDCSLFEPCSTFLDIKPLLTAEGDATVVTPSASAMNEETYYFNMAAFNHSNDTTWTHANMLAADSMHNLVRDIITEEPRSAAHVTTTKPTAASVGKRLRLSVHSPVTIGIRDAQGRFTGVVPNPDPTSDIPVIVQEIPNSYYFEIGEGKYIGFNATEMYDVQMEGTGYGTFTLEVEETDGDQITDAIAYTNIPVSPSTVAQLHIQNLENRSSLEIDENGDGIIDETVKADGESMSLNELISTIKAEIASLEIKASIKNNLLKVIESIEKKIEKKKQENAKILLQFGKKIKHEEMKGRIEAADSEEVLLLLSILEADVVGDATLNAEVLTQLKAKIEMLNIKQGLKKDLLKRVARLENVRVMTNALEHASKEVVKKARKGTLIASDAQKLLDLLTQIENAL